MKKYDDLAKLAELRDRGILSEEEFQQEKAKILQDNGTSFARFFQPPGEQFLFGLKEDTYCMLLHLSQFLTFFIPPFGIVVPIVLWFLGKEKSDWVDRHGRVLFNWWISFLIYFAICVGLSYLFIGFPLLLALVVCAIVFPIVVAVKASEGILWTYPLSFDFFGIGKPDTQNSRSPKSRTEQPNREKTADKKPSQKFDTHFNPNKYR